MKGVIAVRRFLYLTNSQNPSNPKIALFCMPKPILWTLRAYLMICLLAVASVELGSLVYTRPAQTTSGIPTPRENIDLGVDFRQLGQNWLNARQNPPVQENANLKNTEINPEVDASSQTQVPSSFSQLKEEDEDDHGHHHELVKIVRPAGLPAPLPKPPKQASIKKLRIPLTGFVTSNVADGSNAVDTKQVFEFTFDSGFSKETADQFKFYPPIDFTKNWTGNVLRVQPNRLQRDQDYVFGLEKNHACESDTSSCSTTRESSFLYALGFRTKSYDRVIYGYSVQGRELVAYYFGNSNANGKRILLNGAIHGNEWRSGDLNRLVNYLIDNPQELRSVNKTLIIIPFSNPDGVAADIRFNLNGVDLNRNFPTLWTNCSRCGGAPLSEPESLALYQLTLNEKITHVIAYHAQWPPYGIIFRGNDNDPGDVYFANWIATKTGYPVGAYPGTVPGDQTIWADSVGLDAALIEATYTQNSDWDKNYPLYLALIREF
jgi:Zinc carboxypeptidase